MAHEGPHDAAATGQGPISEVVREVLQNAPFMIVLGVCALAWVVRGGRTIATGISFGCVLGLVGGAMFGAPWRWLAILATLAALAAAVTLFRPATTRSWPMHSVSALGVAIAGGAFATAGLLKAHHRGEIREWSIVLGTAGVVFVCFVLCLSALVPTRIRASRIGHPAATRLAPTSRPIA